MHGQRRVLVVNADDLGYSRQRDAGILQAFRDGIVTSVSLLVNGATSREAAEQAVSLGVPLGLHLNLTEGRCVSAAPNGLCAGDSEYMRGKMGFRKAAEAGEISEQEIEREIELQLAKFRELTGGKEPTHVDGHQHCHITAPVRRVFARTLSKAGIRITRVPFEWPLYLLESPNAPFLESVYHDACSSREVFSEYGLVYCNAFVGLSLSFAPSFEKIWSSFMSACPMKAVGDIFCEWMVHPGLPEAADGYKNEMNPFFRPDEFALSKDRVTECMLLCDPALKNVLTKSEGFALSSFTALSNLKEPEMLRRHETQGHLSILTSATPFTGNQSTALRLRSILRTSLEICSLLDVSIVDANALHNPEQWMMLVSKTRVTCAIGVHALRAGRFLNFTWPAIPFTIVLGGTDMNETWPKDDVEEMVLALTRASTIVAFNDFLASKANALVPSANEKCVMIPQSALIPSPTEFNLRKYAKVTRNGPIFLLPLGVRKVKDPLFALKCFQSENGIGRTLEATLIIVGPNLDPVLYASLEKACLQDDLCIRLLNPLPREYLIDAMRQSDFVMNTSISEGQCNTILEAMTLGKLVIVRDNAGNRALVSHGINGLVFDSIESLETLATEAWNDKSWQDEMMSNAKKSAANLSSLETERSRYSILAKMLIYEHPIL